MIINVNIKNQNAYYNSKVKSKSFAFSSFAIFMPEADPPLAETFNF